MLAPGIGGASGEDVLDDPAVDVGESIVTPLMPVDRLLVVESELVEHRRVEIVNLDGILDDVVREVVGLARRRCRA